MLVTAVLSGVILVLLVTLIVTATRYSGQRKSLFDMIERLDTDLRETNKEKNRIESNNNLDLFKQQNQIHANYEKAYNKLITDYVNELNKYKFPNSNTLKYMQKISMEGSYCYFNYIDAGYVYLTNPEYCKQFGEAGKKVNIIQFEEGLKACTIVLLKD